MVLTFTVRGLPVAQGSARAFIAGGRAIVATDANRPRTPLGAWRTAIATEARAAIADEPLLEGPIKVVVTFVMPRPRSHYLPANRQRPVPELRLDAPVFHTGKPDVDKLERALFDALKNVVWRDDAQVAEVRARKCYERPETNRSFWYRNTPFPSRALAADAVEPALLPGAVVAIEVLR